MATAVMPTIQPTPEAFLEQAPASPALPAELLWLLLAADTRDGAGWSAICLIVPDMSAAAA
jgi:hypothetical protein